MKFKPGCVWAATIVLAPVLCLVAYIGFWLAAPLLGPILPRPDVVPRRGAVAHWDLKGFGGVAWEWCQATSNGRIVWGSFDDGAVVRLGIKLGETCRKNAAGYWGPSDVAVWISRTMAPRVDFGAPQEAVDRHGEFCGHGMPIERMHSIRGVVAESRSLVHGRQAQLLAQVDTVLRDLKTDASGRPVSSDSDCG